MRSSSTQVAAVSAARGRRLAVLGWVALICFVTTQATWLMISPPETGMGHLQKIMYVHVPTAWAAFVAFFVVGVASLMYLARRNERADLLAASAAEVGTVLTGLTLLLGSIWARPTWGIWWTWDPRLTTTAILFTIFVAYLALRAFTEDPEQRARWSAAVGLLGALNVPVVYMSVRWWRTIHQIQSNPDVVDTVYTWGLRANGIAVLLLAIYFIGRRYRASLLERSAEVTREERALATEGVHA